MLIREVVKKLEEVASRVEGEVATQSRQTVYAVHLEPA
ncbi:hypothetical protein Pyrfu_0493 [Pyrolobus fumarii 1A]|uniref:Uncharacterized protein n=1 Tax=Pyrolobus fumarii (strain DSM 11204 / 1A) TaxID=694429 RepID=G0EGJ0_PYRF1|nr:hypothetical protein Pyrfu_0493 [Pyrolobus fumarii 1A]